VVVYCALDQVYSEPILQDFERSTGIKVLAKYDLEATKTSGLVNQLMMEKESPRCDVFWNNEILQTVVLKRLDLLEAYDSPSATGIPSEFRDPEHYWTGIAARLRVIVYNPEKLAEREPPASIFELSDPKWKGETAMALPLFGTTLTHCSGLVNQLGEEKTKEWLEGGLNNGLAVVDGNAVVKDRVVAGTATWGLTDSDDANSAMEDGAQIKMLIPDQEEGGLGTLVIPNTVALIKGGPNPESARKLVDYLLSQQVEERLAQGRSLQIPLHAEAKLPPGVPDVAKLRLMDVDYEVMAEKFAEVMNWLRKTVTR
jgi:iron(III) transport system substrate-binding protein